VVNINATAESKGTNLTFFITIIPVLDARCFNAGIIIRRGSEKLYEKLIKTL